MDATQLVKGVLDLAVLAVLASGIALTLPRTGAVSLRAPRDGLRQLLAHRPMARLLGYVFVVYLFLNSWRSTVITGLTLPIALIGARERRSASRLRRRRRSSRRASMRRTSCWILVADALGTRT